MSEKATLVYLILLEKSSYNRDHEAAYMGEQNLILSPDERRQIINELKSNRKIKDVNPMGQTYFSCIVIG